MVLPGAWEKEVNALPPVFIGAGYRCHFRKSFQGA